MLVASAVSLGGVMDWTATFQEERSLVLPRQGGPVDAPRPAATTAVAPEAAAHLLRRPVYDDDLALAGYELMVLGAPTAQQQVEAVLTALTELPPAVLAGGGTLFVRLPLPFLTGAASLPALRGAVVLEVAEESLADPEAVAGLPALAAAGHRLALAGCTWSPSLRPLLPLFRVARVDVSRVGTAGLAALSARLGERRMPLFVQGVETLQQLEVCRRVGATFLSGGLVSRPPVLADDRLAPSQLACLRLTTALVRPDVDFFEVELAVRSDPALTMRVLKSVNSASGGARQRVSSIRQAIVLLGPRALLGSVLTAGLSRSGAETPPEAVEAVLVRARMCELLATTALAARGTAVDGSAAFTVGLVAGLDTLLGSSLSAIVAELPVDEAVETAVLHRTGPLGAVLGDVVAYEDGRSPRLVEVAELRALFLASLSWVTPRVG
jgi:EAL and modified HD-GYP domain-containing signal transduction protein